MKLIIAGSRTIDVPPQFIDGIFWKIGWPTEVVSGMAEGIDKSGVAWTKTQGTGEDFLVKSFYPDWEKHGKAAGPIRNKEMADYADALLLIWDGTSPGSKNMKDHMLRLKKPVYEVILKVYNVNQGN